MRMRSGAWLALGVLGLVLLTAGPVDAQKKTLTIGGNREHVPYGIKRRRKGRT